MLETKIKKTEVKETNLTWPDLGQTRRLGLLGAKRTTITVHRSEEVIPTDLGRHLVRQSTSVSSEGDAAGGVGDAANPDPLEGAETERWESLLSQETPHLGERRCFEKD